MRVDVEDIVKIYKKLEEINNLSFKDIEFFKNGKKLIFTKEEIEQWCFLGLSNVDFILDKSEVD